jgi:PAS domain S-box-containing protein
VTDRDDEAHGVPADGTLDQPHEGLLGRPGERHWKQSTITNPSLDERGGIFFAAIEMTRMPMILTDPRQTDNPVVFANNAFLDLTGYELEEIIGRNCRFLQGAQTDRAMVGQLRDAIAERRAVSAEILNYRRDGSPFWNGVFIGPVYDDQGEILYFFASQLDISQRKEAEASALQGQKMEAIGQLTAGLAHDFNNLLQVVSGSLEVMALKRDDEKAFKRYHDAAVAATQRGAKLTGQLLSFARRSRLEPRRVELSASSRRSPNCSSRPSEAARSCSSISAGGFLRLRSIRSISKPRSSMSSPTLETPSRSAERLLSPRRTRRSKQTRLPGSPLGNMCCSRFRTMAKVCRSRR